MFWIVNRKWFIIYDISLSEVSITELGIGFSTSIVYSIHFHTQVYPGGVHPAYTIKLQTFTSYSIHRRLNTTGTLKFRPRPDAAPSDMSHLEP